MGLVPSLIKRGCTSSLSPCEDAEGGGQFVTPKAPHKPDRGGTRPGTSSLQNCEESISIVGKPRSPRYWAAAAPMG